MRGNFRFQSALRGAAVALASTSLAIAAHWQPRLIIQWLSTKQPDVMFHVSASDSVVALTIDDGPHASSTPEILAALSENEARATFFIIGEHVRGNEALLRRIVDDGHEVGNHLLRDEASALLSPEEFEEQLVNTHRLLAPYASPRWFRPGSGWYNGRMLAQARKHGYRAALGSVYPFDAQVPWRWYVTQYILRNASPGGVIIVHDGPNRGLRTAQVLRAVLPILRKRGYRFVTLSELENRDAPLRTD